MTYGIFIGLFLWKFQTKKEKRREMIKPRANEASEESQQPRQYVYYTSETHGFTSPDSFVVFFGPNSKGPTVPWRRWWRGPPMTGFWGALFPRFLFPALPTCPTRTTGSSPISARWLSIIHRSLHVCSIALNHRTTSGLLLPSTWWPTDKSNNVRWVIIK